MDLPVDAMTAPAPRRADRHSHAAPLLTLTALLAVALLVGLGVLLAAFAAPGSAATVMTGMCG